MEGHKIEAILGATGTKSVDGDDELPSINAYLFDFFQWLKDIKSINTCWLQSKNNQINLQMIPAGHTPIQLSSRPSTSYQVLLTKIQVLCY